VLFRSHRLNFARHDAGVKTGPQAQHRQHSPSDPLDVDATENGLATRCRHFCTDFHRRSHLGDGIEARKVDLLALLGGELGTEDQGPDPMIAGPEGGPSSDMQRYEGYAGCPAQSLMHRRRAS